MKRDDYVDKLEKMYEEFYTGEGGYCRYFDECRKGIGDKPCKFKSDKARVGEYYGNSGVPKIVFVGLEGLNVHTLVDYPDDSAYNTHYKGVRYVLAYLLSPFIGKEHPNSVLKRCLKNYTEYTIKYFALLNCYKCAFGDNPRSRTHTSSMQKNCQEILFREIEILDPDIVVFQVKSKRPENFTEKLKDKFDYGTSDNLIYGNDDTGAFRYSLPSGKKFIWIWTYHGSGRTYSNKQGWACNDESGKVYREKELDPVLNKVIETLKNQNDKLD